MQFGVQVAWRQILLAEIQPTSAPEFQKRPSPVLGRIYVGIGTAAAVAHPTLTSLLTCEVIKRIGSVAATVMGWVLIVLADIYEKKENKTTKQE